MKYYLTLFMLIYFAHFSDAQDNFYKQQWIEVAKLEKDGLTKSASKLVDNIYDRTKSEDNTTQNLKCLLYQSKYIQILEEDAQLTIVNNFKSEIKNSNTVTKHILENTLANLYWQYFKQNRYQFYNRTKTDKKVNDDFRTWDLETLFAEIHTYYQSSLQNGLLLQQESLNTFDEIIIEVENSKIYRPTLFDFLSHNALEFYKTDENSITKPAYKFQIDNPAFIADSEVFIDLEIASKDSVNLQLNALKIYQNLLKFHRKDKISEAFVSADIERLKFVKQHAIFNDVEKQLIKTLQANADELKGNALSGLYKFEIANLLFDQGIKYNASIKNDKVNDGLRWKLKEALSICEAVITDFPESDGATKCKILKHKILQPNLTLKAESFVPNNKSSLVLVTYKNLEALDLKIYKIKKSQLS